jgi:hypothetical protein
MKTTSFFQGCQNGCHGIKSFVQTSIKFGRLSPASGCRHPVHFILQTRIYPWTIKTLPCRRKAPSTWTQPVRADTNPRPGYVRMGRDSRPCGRGCAFEQKIYHASDLPPTRFLHADTIVAKSHKRSRGQRPHLDVHVYPRDNLGFFVQETCLNSFIIQNIDALTIKD